MIARNALNKGAILSFPGMDVEIVSVLGQGSNAIVYKGSYEDGLTENVKHTVLVKELFPLHPKGLIYRDEAGKIVCQAEAKEFFDLNRLSFERGNRAHLKLLELFPDKIGGNVNTYERNGTFYTVLSESGGRDIAASEKPKTLKILVRRMLSVLDSLSAFHETNLMHLDISPDNILLIGKGESERCMLIDYNSAFSPEDMYLGEETYFSIKQGFTAPEVINKNMTAVSWSTDLYSVCAVFFFMLMDRPLSLRETLLKNPPDVSQAELLKDAPETVLFQISAILKKGLASIPARRYRDISQMREAFLELMRRIDMLGVTHASIFEAGKKGIQKLTRENPFYRYLTDEGEMFPVRLEDENGKTQTMDEFLDAFLSENGESMSVVSLGGMGKTTLLLKTALSLSESYSQTKPAQMYISLAGKKSGAKDFLIDEILKSLRFTSDTVTYDGARHQLRALLSTPLKTKNGDVPALVLLLDGLNEATGDTALLQQEINELNKLSGLRMLITSRSEDEGVRFPRISLSFLTEADVENALSKRGLLKPESKEIESLLKTPLMLSVFLKASTSGEQLTVNTEEDLLDAYIASLLTKEKDAVGDDEGQKYRIDAAVRFVLCALALRAEKSGGAITRTEAFDVVRKCRKTLLSRNLSRAFPMWIGHRKDIVLSSDDEFFGEIVLSILVKRMGLVVKMAGDARISHARIGEYLARKHAENEKRIKKRKMLSASAFALVLVFLLSGGYVAFDTWLSDYRLTIEEAKKPYDDEKAERSLTFAVNGYTEYGALYEKMAELLEGALVYPDGFLDEDVGEEFAEILIGFQNFDTLEAEFDYIDDLLLPFMDQWLEWREDEKVIDTRQRESHLSYSMKKWAGEKHADYAKKIIDLPEKNLSALSDALKNAKNASASQESRTQDRTKAAYERYINEMILTGEVCSWSQKPFDAENAIKLIWFSDECREVYKRAEEYFRIWEKSERLMGSCPEFKERFIELIRADAIVAVQMYQVVCAPHMLNEEDIWQPERMKNIALFSGMQTFFDAARSKEVGENALQDLMNAEARKQEALTALNRILTELELYIRLGGY